MISTSPSSATGSRLVLERTCSSFKPEAFDVARLAHLAENHAADHPEEAERPALLDHVDRELAAIEVRDAGRASKNSMPYSLLPMSRQGVR